jgi:hypothetical protein
MNPANSPLLNRLIFLVLCLNLVCLALLVIRSYHQPLPPLERGPAGSVASAPAPMEQATPEPLAPVSPRPPAAPQAPRGVVAPVPPAPLPLNDATLPQEPAPPLPIPAPAPFVNLGDTRGVRTGTSPGGATQGSSADLPSLSGMVTLSGTPKPEIPIILSPQCGPSRPRPLTTRHFVVNSEGGLANVLVWLQNARPAPPQVEPPVLDQIGCMFEPYVMAVVARQNFLVRNSDRILHNLHFTPKTNRERNFAQTHQGQESEVSFPRPELGIRLKCDVHPWMFAYVHVLEHPYFAVTDTNGLFQIPRGFPPGRYLVAAYHLKAGEASQQIDLRAGDQRFLRFELRAPEAGQAKNP